MAEVWLAGEGEAPTVAGLLVEFRDWWKRDAPARESFDASVWRLMEGADAEFLLAARRAGEPAAGVCQLRYRYVLWVEGEECLLEDLFVRDDDRRGGLGAALVDAAIERARARGCRRMQLDVNEANPAALALYEEAGFDSWFDPPGGHNRNLRLAL